jgi:SAM-dependent methyltransferase
MGSIPHRLTALAGGRARPRPAAGNALPARRTAQPTDARGNPPSAALAWARAAVAALLVDVERLRPGLVLHRSLDLDVGSGVRAQALCESFAECYAVCADADAAREAEEMNRHSRRCRYVHATGRHELSFPDEMFDLVYCGTLKSDEHEDSEGIIAEVLRVLRLQGVAVVDLPGRQAPAAPPPADSLGVVRTLVHLPAPGTTGLSMGETRQIAVTVANAGDRVLGSAVVPLQLESRWRRPGGAPGSARRTAIDGVLVPGDSRLAALPVTVPDTSGVHVLELSLFEESPWGEPKTQTVTLAVAVGGSAQQVLGRPMDETLPDVHRRVCAAVARADGVMLGARPLEPREPMEPCTRVFFTHA